MTDQNQMGISKEDRVEKLKKLLSFKKNLEESIIKNINKRDDISGTKLALEKEEQRLSSVYMINEMTELAEKFGKCKKDEDFTKEAGEVVKYIQNISDEEKKKKWTAALGKITRLFGEFLKSNKKNGFKAHVEACIKPSQEAIKVSKNMRTTLESQIGAMDSIEEKIRNSIKKTNEEINKYLDNFRKGWSYENELKGIDLSGQNLMDLDFSNLNLKESKLVGSMLYKANFSGSDLSGSDLSLAYAPNSKFEETNLEGVKFNTKVNLNNINNLIPNSAKDKKETVITSANLNKVNLNRVNLDRVNLEQSTMEEASLKGTKFTKNTNIFATKLCKSNLDKTDFSDAKFDKTAIDVNQKVLLEEKKVNTEKCIIKEIELSKQQIHPTEHTIQGVIKVREEEQQLTFMERREKLKTRQNNINNKSIPFS